ncbi:MAG TPA: MBL fold metallo-hydrolase [Allosphingosinicella sp.]|jgi:L-ascorbate metabolism protein UlaG (beta-lactamase superfamily)
MGRLGRGLGKALLFLAVAICFTPTLVPPFLDRIYHRGEPSDHYDGKRFFNPGFAEYHSDPKRFINRVLGAERTPWPESVPVRQSVPPRRVEGEEMRVTWIGHATVLVQSGGINILTDPIWSDRASPFSFAGPKRVRAPGVRFEDLPKIDIVLVSHNHYDHMDLPTLKRLWERDRPLIVTSLGNESILEGRGIEAVALDWKGGRAIGNGASVTVERNHHWSSRWGTDRNRALWSAFTIRMRGGNIFFAGDTGWGDGSWVREAAARGPYRLAIIPIGAYEPRDFMKTNHVNPEEAVAIFEALKPTAALGVHWGTFQLTFEGIDEPRQRLARLRRERGIADNRFIATEAGQSFTIP